MTFKLEIDLGNDAFDNNTAEEIARILSECSADRILWWIMQGNDDMRLRDINGNTVGRAWVES